MRFRDLTFDANGPALVMGILNVTPDSFYDGGRYRGVDAARARAAQMVREGASLIDVGGRSYGTGPNGIISAADESARVVPVIEALAAERLGVALTVDTVHASVAEAALAAGAHAINDCSGLADAALPGVVARYDAALFVMHIRGAPNVPQDDLAYEDAIGEIASFLRARIDRALAAGIARDSIVIDPGLEFGKALATDVEIVARFSELRALGYPLLLAASRKDFIGALVGKAAPERLAGSLAVAALGIASGAAIVRAHDVAETLDVAHVLAAVRASSSSTAR